MTAVHVPDGSRGAAQEPLVKVEGLTIDFWSNDRWNNVVNNTSFELRGGEALGLVGESGCGKTTTALSLLGFQRPGSRIRSGAIYFGGRDLAHVSRRELQKVRGRRVSLVPQNPTTALSPGLRIGDQLAEAMSVHGVGGSRAERQRRVRELIAHVRLPDAERTMQKYPHQLSGGQQQRMVIAMALACDPELIVLDEPTTDLDVTTQAQILDLLRRLRAELGMAMVYVTHNLGVVATICDRVGVMYAGELVEDAPVRELFTHPRHPYTRGLISAVPSIAEPHRSRRGRPAWTAQARRAAEGLPLRAAVRLRRGGVLRGAPGPASRRRGARSGVPPCRRRRATHRRAHLGCELRPARGGCRRCAARRR